MKKKILFLVFLILMSALFTSCGKDYITLNVYNVGDYIDEELITKFEEENPNIKINYETYYTNEEMHVKVANEGSNYDVVFPSDYMLERMIKENLLRKIDYKNIPNFNKIGDVYKNLDYDPKQEYSVPYMWGTMGILYNKTMVKEKVDSWKILWDKKYTGNVFMLDSERDTLGITLKMLGYSMNTSDDGELLKAQQALIEQKPIVLAYAGDEVKDKMINGEGALTVAWSGDAYYCIEKNPDLAYAIPKEGTNLWFDVMAIPISSEHPKEAEKFIDFLTRLDVAKQNTEYIAYASPIPEVVDTFDDSIKNDKDRYPDLNDMSKYDIFKFDETLTKKQSEVWQKVKTAQ